MADVTGVAYTHKDLMTVMLKDQKIHEGFWQLLINFGLGVANVGQTNDSIHPSAIIQVTSVGLSKVVDGTEPNNMVFDAAELNPRTKSKAQRAIAAPKPQKS